MEDSRREPRERQGGGEAVVTKKTGVTPSGPASVRAGLGADALAQALVDNLHYLQAKLPRHATRNDWYMALAYTVRDRMLERYIRTIEAISGASPDVKAVAYLSAEFLTGPHLGNSLICLGIWQAAEEALSRVGQDLSAILEQEEEPGLGNGGLGRLAACYMDSLATLNVPAIGYGIRYEFGIFDQAIRDGWQVELTDKWLRFGNPWEIVRSEITFDVQFGGRTEHVRDDQGRDQVRWLPEKVVKGVAYDTPVPGYRVRTTNLLRLWKAEATESFDFDAFNAADYYGAVDQKVASETISKVLYPNDEPEAGKQLRLEQQYFFVSCSLQDMIRLHLMRGKDLAHFDRYWAAQLNDTHPSIAVAELMRLLVDEHLLPWDEAWGITQRTCGYTNHTLLAEALEKWPLPLFGQLLPRHLQIIYEINRRFLDDVRRGRPGDDQLLRRVSIIDEAGDKYIRMAHLAAVGQPCDQRSGGSPYGAAQADRAQRLPRAHAGQVPQRDQRRHAEALDGAEQPEAERAHHRPHRQPVDVGSGRRAPAHRAAGRRCGVPGRVARGQSRQQTGPGRFHQGAHRHHRGSAVAVRRPGETAARVQAAAPERPLPDHPVHPAQGGVRRRGCAAHRDLRRQGCARLPDGQADHQVDQFRRRRRQQRPQGVRCAQGGVPARLQRQEQPCASTPPPICRSRSPPRARKRRARAT